MNKNAFTMIELIFAIVIIGILSAVALPKFFDLRFKTELANLKSEIEAINSKTNSQLLKNIILGSNNSFEDFETKTPDPNKIFTNLFKDGLDKGNENKGWFYLGKKEDKDSAITPWDAKYNPEADYKNYLSSVTDRTKDGVYLIYKYSITDKIYFNFLYKSKSAKFECAKSVCDGCNSSRTNTIKNLIKCFE